MSIVSSLPVPLTVDAEPVTGYRLRQPRGTGGFAEVWEADGPWGRRVALKCMATDRMGAQRNSVREIRSIQAIRHLRHPGLIPIHGVWSIPGWIVVAMDLADGSMMDLLQAYEQECGTAVPPDVLLPYMRQAGEAIDFLNTRGHQVDGKRVGIQHADIKPNNILLFDEQAKLADFGLATLLSTPRASGYCCGTLAYAAPEVFQGLIATQTDQYSLAVTYCVLRTGSLPFASIRTEFSRDQALPALDLRRLTPGERPIVERALAVAPADRWPDCRNFVAELSRVSAGPPRAIQVRSHTPKRLSRSYLITPGSP